MKKTVWRGWGADNTKWPNALVKCCISFSLFWTKKKEKWPDQSLQKAGLSPNVQQLYNVLPFYMSFYLLMPFAHKPPINHPKSPPIFLANFVLQLCEFGSYIFQGVLLMIQQLRCWRPSTKLTYPTRGSSSSENHLQFCAFLVGILVRFLEGNKCLHRIAIYTSLILRWFLCRRSDSIISDRGAGMHVCQQWKCNTMKIVVHSKSKVQTTFRYHITFTSFDQKCVNPRNHRPIQGANVRSSTVSCDMVFSFFGVPLLGIALFFSPHWGILQKYINSWSYICWTKALDWLDPLRFCKKMGLLVTQLAAEHGLFWAH